MKLWMSNIDDTRFFNDLTNKDTAEVGGKNASLSEMIGQLGPKGIRIPSGFAITSGAYWHFLEHNGLREKVAETLEKLDEKDLKNLKRIGEKLRRLILEGTSPFWLFFKQFNDFLMLLLFIAAGIAFWAEQMVDVYIILAVILFSAIGEGRIVFNNVRITSYFLTTTNFAFGLAFIISMMLGFPLFLTAVQVLYVNLVTAGIVAMASAIEPGHGDMVKQPPVKKSEKILQWDILPFLLIVLVVIALMSLLTFQHYLSEGEQLARTATFAAVSMTQSFNVFNLRSFRTSVFKIGVFTNPWVNYAFLGALALQVLVIKVPFLREMLEFENLPWSDFLLISLISIGVIAAGELYKYIRFKK